MALPCVLALALGLGRIFRWNEIVFKLGNHESFLADLSHGAGSPASSRGPVMCNSSTLSGEKSGGPLYSGPRGIRDGINSWRS